MPTVRERLDELSDRADQLSADVMILFNEVRKMDDDGTDLRGDIEDAKDLAIKLTGKLFECWDEAMRGGA